MKMTSRSLIASGFLLLLGLLLTMTLISLRQMEVNHQLMESVASQYNVKTDLLNTMRHIARERSMTIFHMLTLRDPFKVEEMRERMSNLANVFVISREKLTAMQLSLQESSNLTSTLEQVRIVAELHAAIMELMEVGNFEAANKKMLNENLPEQNKLLEKYNTIIDIQREATEQALADARSAYNRTIVTTIVLGIFMIVIGLIVSIFVIRNTARIEQNLHILNADLEKRVTDRTEVLEITNSVLSGTISELKMAQSQLVQAEKMASLGNLVAGMAHEINTPLGVSVTSASSLELETKALRHALETGAMRKSDLMQFMEHTEQGCEILLSNLKRTASLVSSFKLVAVDQSSEDWRYINLHAYVEEIVASLRPRLKNTRVEVSNETVHDLMLFTKPGALYQIISNLIVNSLTHAFDAESSGHISILAKHDGAKLHLVYKDDGKGITPENINRVFEPFFTTSRGSGGSGLGLHIVYNLVTSTLLGSIVVKSIPGSGVAFMIDLPIKIEERIHD